MVVSLGRSTTGGEGSSGLLLVCLVETLGDWNIWTWHLNINSNRTICVTRSVHININAVLMTFSVVSTRSTSLLDNTRQIPLPGGNFERKPCLPLGLPTTFKEGKLSLPLKEGVEFFLQATARPSLKKCLTVYRYNDLDNYVLSRLSI